MGYVYPHFLSDSLSPYQPPFYSSLLPHITQNTLLLHSADCLHTHSHILTSFCLPPSPSLPSHPSYFPLSLSLSVPLSHSSLSPPYLLHSHYHTTLTHFSHILSHPHLSLSFSADLDLDLESDLDLDLESLFLVSLRSLLLLLIIENINELIK